MSYTDVLNALDVLVEYPDLREYIIKGFNKPRTSSYEIRLLDLLDVKNNHSGGSWCSMLSRIQEVLKGVLTREFIVEKANAEKKRWDEWKAEQRRTLKSLRH